jgi:hypothetical protein
LVLGSEPGFAKIAKAREQKHTITISAKQFERFAETGEIPTTLPEAEIPTPPERPKPEEIRAEGVQLGYWLDNGDGTFTLTEKGREVFQKG